MSGVRIILEFASGLSCNHKWILEIYTKLWLDDEPIQVCRGEGHRKRQPSLSII